MVKSYETVLGCPTWRKLLTANSQLLLKLGKRDGMLGIFSMCG